jgi:hypothetical protein
MVWLCLSLCVLPQSCGVLLVLLWIVGSVCLGVLLVCLVWVRLHDPICGRISGFSGVFLVSGTIWQMYTLSLPIGLGLLTHHGRNCAWVASGARSMIGNCPWSMHPLFQSILGWNAANQGYPRIALFSPKFERKKRRVDRCVPVCTCRSVKY